LIYVDINQ